MLPPLTTPTRTVGIIPFTTTLTVDTFPSPRPANLDAYLPAYGAYGDVCELFGTLSRGSLIEYHF
jgi:hypothetical protein